MKRKCTIELLLGGKGERKACPCLGPFRLMHNFRPLFSAAAAAAVCVLLRELCEGVFGVSEWPKHWSYGDETMMISRRHGILGLLTHVESSSRASLGRKLDTFHCGESGGCVGGGMRTNNTED